MATAPVLIARATLDRAMDHARAQGLDPLAFHLPGTRRPGPSPAAGNWVPLDALAQFLAWAATASNNPGFGLAVGAKFHPSDLGAFGYMLLNAPDLATALTLGQQFMHFLQAGSAFSTRLEAGLIEITYHPHGLAPHLRMQDTEYTLAIIHAVIRALAGRTLRADCARLAHAAPGREAELRAVFGCPVTTGAAESALCYDAGILAQPVPGADANLLAILTEYVEGELAQAPPMEDFTAQILWAIRASLADGPSLARVARQCGLGTRTLQRRLTEQGLCFSDLVDDVRRDLAAALRHSGRANQDSIAAALGFHDASALAKARRRWAHQTAQA